MSAKKGRSFLLKIGSDTVCNARTTALTINNDPVEVTTACSDGVREYIASAGVASVSVSLDGVWDDSATGDRLLRDRALDGTINSYTIIDEDTSTIVFDGVVVSYELTGTYNDAQLFSCTLESSGSVTITDVGSPG